MMLGMSDGAEHLHHILELPFDSPAFRHDVARRGGLCPQPAVRGGARGVLRRRWGHGLVGQRMLPAEFDDDLDLFTGEHVYPWMFEDYGELAPLREAAELVAGHEWPRLYDPAVLAGNEVPCAAAIYTEDMYVEREFSEETAAQSPECGPGSPASTTTTACGPTAPAYSGTWSTLSAGEPSPDIRRGALDPPKPPASAAAHRCIDGLDGRPPPPARDLAPASRCRDYPAAGGPNQVVSASGSPASVPSPTQATYPSGRISTAVGALTSPRTGSSHTPS